MYLHEHILKAQQTINMVVSDLLAAHRQVCEQPVPPEGRSIADKALAAYLGECIADARKLESKLNQL